MAATFHKLTIKDIRKETHDTVSIAFDIPETLAENFNFIPGQYLTFKKDINGEELRRSYSICSGLNDNELRVAVKKVEQGKFSTFANEQLKSGDSLDIMEPMGKFHTSIDSKNKKNYAAFAAGSGITPIMSIMKSVLEVEPESTFTLFYGNRSIDSIIFHENIEALKNKYLGRLIVHHVLSRERLESDLFYGRIDKDKAEKITKSLIDPNKINEYFLCGPYEMIMDVKEVLESAGIEKSNIHFELFTTPGEKVVRKKTVKQESFIAQLTVKSDGNTFDIKLKNDEDSILDSALKTGADLPFACKGGVCATCKAMLEEGKVEMDVNYGLEEDEIEAGYILTCQAHPTTPKVVVNFDV